MLQNVLSEVVSHLFQLNALATRGKASWNDAAGCAERDSLKSLLLEPILESIKKLWALWKINLLKTIVRQAVKTYDLQNHLSEMCSNCCLQIVLIKSHCVAKTEQIKSVYTEL